MNFVKFLLPIFMLLLCCKSQSRDVVFSSKSLWKRHEATFRKIDAMIRAGKDLSNAYNAAHEIGIKECYKLGDEVVFVVNNSGISVSGTSETIHSRNSPPYHLTKSIDSEIKNGSKVVRLSEKLTDGWYIFYTR